MVILERLTEAVAVEVHPTEEVETLLEVLVVLE
jgi:hypothetical protein